MYCIRLLALTNLIRTHIKYIKIIYNKNLTMNENKGIKTLSVGRQVL